MPQPKPFSLVNATLPGFVRCLKKLPPDVRKIADQALVDLFLPEIPGKYGFKKLGGYKNPALYTIMLGGNHAYKLSMELKAGTAILRRVGSHKEIDGNP